MKCRICAGNSVHAFTRTIMHRYSCKYFFCETCGLLQTEDPYWLPEAYSNAIADSDTGLITRNINISKLVATLLFSIFRTKGKYLDVAGGYGILTRLMRDRGFDYYWSDMYCENLFARGYEAAPDDTFSAVTAFEVLEHVSDPVLFIHETLKQAKTRTFLFSTELFQGTPPIPDSWWYYAFESGQHISFYQHKTLKFIANELGLNFYSHGSIHLLTDQRMSNLKYRIFSDRYVSRLLSLALGTVMHSKTMSDHIDITKMRAKGIKS
jgi:hypothetical protein